MGRMGRMLRRLAVLVTSAGDMRCIFARVQYSAVCGMAAGTAVAPLGVLVWHGI